MDHEKIKQINSMTNLIKNMSYMDLNNNIKMNLVLKFYNLKLENPTMKKKEICKILNVSLPTLNSYLRSTEMGGFVRDRNNKKKTNKIPNIKKDKNKTGGLSDKYNLEAEQLLKNIK